MTTIKQLINAPMSDRQNPPKITYLILEYDDPEVLGLLLASGAYLDSPGAYLFDNPDLTVEAVRVFLEKSTDDNFSTDHTITDVVNQVKPANGHSPLIEYIHHPDIVRLLLQHGANPLHQDNDANTIFDWAISEVEDGDEIYREILQIFEEELSPDLLAQMINLSRPTQNAIYGEFHPEIFTYLIDHGVHLDTNEEDTESFLDLIYKEPNAGELTDILIDRATAKNFTQVPDLAAFLNRRGENNEMPLYYVSKPDQLAIFKQLVEAGAKIGLSALEGLLRFDNLVGLEYAREIMGEEAFRTFTSQLGQNNILRWAKTAPVARFLLEHGSPVTYQTEEGESAVEASNLEVYQVMLEYAPANWLDLPVEGHINVIRYYRDIPEIVEYLVGQGLSLETFDSDGNSPLYYDPTILSIMTRANFPTMSLIEYLDHPNVHGRTVLMEYAKLDKLPLKPVEQLLQLGAAIDYQDEDGATALLLALQTHRQDVALLLLDDTRDSILAFDSLDDYINAFATTGQSAVWLAVDQPAVLAALMKFQPIVDRLVHGQTALHYAAAENETESAKLLLDPGVRLTHFPDYRSYLDAITLEGGTALSLAIEAKQKEAAELLLTTGASVDIPDPEGKLPWMHNLGLFPIDRLFQRDLHLAHLTYKEYLNSSTATHRPALYKAIQAKSDKSINYLLDQGADVNILDRLSNNALMILAKTSVGSVFTVAVWKKIFQRLVKQTSQIDQTNTEGDTAFTIALRMKQPLENLLLFLQHRVNINLADVRGDAPLTKVRSSEILIPMLEYGADPNYAPNGYYPMAAMLNNNRGSAAIAALLAFGADPNAVDFLSIACQEGDMESFNLLLSYGARLPAQPDKKTLRCLDKSKYADREVTRLNAAGQNELTEAIVQGLELEKIKRLIQRTDDINEIDSAGSTALHYAVLLTNVPVVQALLQAGADPQLLNNEAESPLTLAAAAEDQRDGIYELLAYTLIQRGINRTPEAVVYQLGGRAAQQAAQDFGQQQRRPFTCDDPEYQQKLRRQAGPDEELYQELFHQNLLDRVKKLGLKTEAFETMTDAEICAYLKWYNVSDFVLPYEEEVAEKCLGGASVEDLVALAASFGLAETQFQNQTPEDICRYLKRYTQVILRADQDYRPNFSRVAPISASRVKPLPLREPHSVLEDEPEEKSDWKSLVTAKKLLALRRLVETQNPTLSPEEIETKLKSRVLRYVEIMRKKAERDSTQPPRPRPRTVVLDANGRQVPEHLLERRPNGSIRLIPPRETGPVGEEEEPPRRPARRPTAVEEEDDDEPESDEE